MPTAFAGRRGSCAGHPLIEHGDVVGRDSAGRIVIQLAVDDWVLDEPLGSDTDAVELEDGGDSEPDADNEDHRAPFVLPDVVLPRHQSQAADDPGSGPVD